MPYAFGRQAGIQERAPNGTVLIQPTDLLRRMEMQSLLVPVQRVIVAAPHVVVVAELVAVLGAANVHEQGDVGVAFRRIANGRGARVLGRDRYAQSVALVLVFVPVPRDAATFAEAFEPAERIGRDCCDEEGANEDESKDIMACHLGSSGWIT